MVIADRIPRNTIMKANWRKLSSFAAGFIYIFFATVIIATASTSPYHIVVNVKTDRPNALYNCGEKATFLISLREAVGGLVEGGELSAKLTLDGLKKIAEKKLTVGEKPMSVTGTLSEPGFLRCEVEYSLDEKTYKGYAAAGFEPERIKAMTRMPEDFDAFWDEGRAELAKIPLDVRLTPLPQYSDNC
jgi:cephalosporin-C deacetylase